MSKGKIDMSSYPYWKVFLCGAFFLPYALIYVAGLFVVSVGRASADIAESALAELESRLHPPPAAGDARENDGTAAARKEKERAGSLEEAARKEKE